MTINYYLIGSHYNKKDGEQIGILDDMVSRKVVSIDWAKEVDLSNRYGKSDKSIIDYLKKKERPISYSNVKRFLRLKPGDMVAIKSWLMKGGEGSITVLAYARVVKRKGKVYSWDKATLGHMINVEYIKKDVSLRFPYNLSQAVHQVTDDSRINDIFSGFQRQKLTDAKDNQSQSKGTNKKNTKTQKRSGARSYTATQKHNELQQKVYNFLVSTYGETCVKMEWHHMDIVLTQGKIETIFEVKAYYSIKKCIREALGQLIEYSYTNKNLSNVLCVVGLSKANEEDLGYIRFVQDRTTYPFYYKRLVKGVLT